MAAAAEQLVFRALPLPPPKHRLDVRPRLGSRGGRALLHLGHEGALPLELCPQIERRAFFPVLVAMFLFAAAVEPRGWGLAQPGNAFVVAGGSSEAAASSWSSLRRSRK
jgi:hypothetical protein